MTMLNIFAFVLSAFLMGIGGALIIMGATLCLRLLNGQLVVPT